jgi:alpha-beta hydrolase superfamily lysophospholipase
MEHREGHFGGVGGHQLYYQSWQPEGDPRAVLGILHGMGGHSSQYTGVAEDLVSRGYAVYGFDGRGHGRSEGRRGHIDSWEEVLGDLRAFVQVVGEQMPGQPVFLLGISLGGVIVLDYAERDPAGFQGIIASGVPLEQEAVSPILLAIVRLLSRIAPRFTINLNIDKTAITRDPAEIKAREEDPLWYSAATARCAVEMSGALERVKAHAADLRLPLLMNHGEKDRIGLVSGAQAFFDAVTYPDRELKIYEGGCHDPFCDLDREQVLADLDDWMKRHL